MSTFRKARGQDHGLETRTLFWKTGSWTGNQDAVRGDGIVVVKIYRIPPESLACSVPDRSFD